MRRYQGGLSDIEIILITGATCSVLYIALSIVLGKSQVPILVVVFIGSNMISRTGVFQTVKTKAAEVLGKWSTSEAQSIPTNRGEGYEKFIKLSSNGQVELLSAIKSLQSYSSQAKSTNERRSKLFGLMSWRQQKACENVGYLKKLRRIDQLISCNQKFLDMIVDCSVRKFGISYQDFDILKKSTNSQATSTSNYRVIESLNHFTRDWSARGDEETAPLLKYITDSLNSIIPVDERQKTCIVIPGSGLGKIAHEIASIGQNNKFGGVHAVEYSGLMHLCNNFMYESTKKSETSKIFTGIHTCSNFYSNEGQFDSTDILVGQAKPDSLSIHLEDFRYFSIPNKDKYENIVVLTAFFIDTAENLMDYFDTIQTLATPNSRTNKIKNGYWINAGPLKYGSAAQVELNSDEIKQIRKNSGWVDLSCINSIEDHNPYTNNGLVGYVTDKKSMWQGYYGLSMWASKRKENNRQNMNTI